MLTISISDSTKLLDKAYTDYVSLYTSEIVSSEYYRDKIKNLINSHRGDYYVIIRKQGQVVGGATIFISDNKSHDFPIDSPTASKMVQHLAKKFKIAYVGRLVTKKGTDSIIMNFIYQGVINILTKENIVFIISESNQKLLYSYINMGFEFLCDKKHLEKCVYFSEDFGQNEYPLLFNMLSYALSKGKKKYHSSFLNNVDGYLLEKWFKKKIIRLLFNRNFYNIDKENLYQLSVKE